MDFVCRFMTVDLWRAAGRPIYTAPDGSHWRPWYYGDASQSDNNLLYEGAGLRRHNEGLLEALQQTDTLPDEYDPAYVSRYWKLFRYTPWSVHVQRALGCGPAQGVAADALTARGLDRSRLLGFGWSAIAPDDRDPTGALSAGALPAILALAYAHTADGATAREAINTLARGEGARPDFDRDGEVWLVSARGRGRALMDLDKAVGRAARVGRLFVNAAGRTWRQGLAAAAARARDLNRPLVFIYFAGDGFHPAASDDVFAERLRYLVRGAARRAARGEHITVYGPAGYPGTAALVAHLPGVAVLGGAAQGPCIGAR